MVRALAQVGTQQWAWPAPKYVSIYLSSLSTTFNTAVIKISTFGVYCLPSRPSSRLVSSPILLLMSHIMSFATLAMVLLTVLHLVGFRYAIPLSKSCMALVPATHTPPGLVPFPSPIPYRNRRKLMPRDGHKCALIGERIHEIAQFKPGEKDPRT